MYVLPIIYKVREPEEEQLCKSSAHALSTQYTLIPLDS